MDGYSSHLPMLLACVAKTEGPILELGAGFGSTPILRAISVATGRTVLTVESNADWLARLGLEDTERHKLLHTPPDSWHLVSQIDEAWDVVLVDHAPGDRRKRDIPRLADKCQLVVVHDSEPSPPGAGDYGYEPVFRRFRHRFDFKKYSAWTTVLSNRDNLHFLRGFA